MKKIPVAGPWITDLERGYVVDAVENAWYDQAGKYCKLFEAAFADYVGVKHAVSLPHCTSGIHLLLEALNIGPGDEVIVPDVTWIASAAPISQVGAEPCFVDIDPQTWCLDPQSVIDNINEHTKAIIAVDLYGSMPAMRELTAIAEQYGLYLIEDAAEAIGSEYFGGKAGSFGCAGVFSFHGSKTLTTGEGGMLVTDNSELFDRILFLRDHGRVPGDVTFNNAEVGFKYKMSDLQAAVGYGQLQRVDELVDKKRQIFSWYAERLQYQPMLSVNVQPEGIKNSYWMTSVIIDSSIEAPKIPLMSSLQEKGVSTRPFFSPLSAIPAYSQLQQSERAREQNKTAYAISAQALNLPSALSISEGDVDLVCSVLMKELGL